MREHLMPFHGRRITVQGIFDRHVKYNNIQTALFQALEHDGKYLCSHTYVQYAGAMLDYDLQFGEMVQFSASVIQYRKAWKWPAVTDYGLTHPVSVTPLDRRRSRSAPFLENEDFSWGATQAGMSQSDLTAALQKLASKAGGYEALQTTLDHLRQ